MHRPGPSIFFGFFFIFFGFCFSCCFSNFVVRTEKKPKKKYKPKTKKNKGGKTASHRHRKKKKTQQQKRKKYRGRPCTSRTAGARASPDVPDHPGPEPTSSKNTPPGPEMFSCFCGWVFVFFVFCKGVVTQDPEKKGKPRLSEQKKKKKQ